MLSIAVTLPVSEALVRAELATEGSPPFCAVSVTIGAGLVSSLGADTVVQELALPLDGLFCVLSEDTEAGLPHWTASLPSPRTGWGGCSATDMADGCESETMTAAVGRTNLRR